MGLATQLTGALRPVVDLVYPPRCPVCSEAIAAQDGLCFECWTQLAIPADPSCALCQRPLGSAAMEEGALCAPCMAAPPLHDGIRAATLYNEASRRLVLNFKHGRRLGLAPLLANLMAARMPAIPEDTLLVPVPLHRWRLWHRGFNQAAMLARELGRRKGGTLAVAALERTRSTRSLGGLGRKEREKVLKGAIRVAPRWLERLQGCDVILVDDVLTSGATTSACVRALKQAGARSVRIACFARVMPEALAHGS